MFEGTTDKAIEADLCDLCGIHIDHYVHAWDPSRKGVDSKCRDIPYKFDSPSETIWRTARGKPLGDRERNLVDFLEGSLKAKSEVLTDREFRDLVDSLDAQAQAKLRAMQDAGADNEQASSFLKGLFWGDFPWNALVPPEAKEPPMDTVVGAPPLVLVSDKPAHVSPPTTGPALPTTRRDIKRWLTSEAYVLEPHARKQFTTDNIASIVSFIMEEVAEPMRPDVLIDIRERLANESRKIFHNIKGDGIIAFLRRRWRSDR